MSYQCSGPPVHRTLADTRLLDDSYNWLFRAFGEAEKTIAALR